MKAMKKSREKQPVDPSSHRAFLIVFSGLLVAFVVFLAMFSISYFSIIPREFKRTTNSIKTIIPISRLLLLKEERKVLDAVIDKYKKLVKNNGFRTIALLDKNYRIIASNNLDLIHRKLKTAREMGLVPKHNSFTSNRLWAEKHGKTRYLFFLKPLYAGRESEKKGKLLGYIYVENTSINVYKRYAAAGAVPVGVIVLLTLVLGKITYTISTNIERRKQRETVKIVPKKLSPDREFIETLTNRELKRVYWMQNDELKSRLKELKDIGVSI